MQFTLQDLFWDYLALELTLDSIYYSGVTELSGWWTYGLTGYIYIYINTGWTGNYLHSGKFFSARVPGGVLKTGQLLSHWTVTSVTVTCLLDLSDSCDRSL